MADRSSEGWRVRVLPNRPGEDAPLFGIRETVEWVDEIVLTGFWAEGSCYVSRRGRSSLLVPSGTPLLAEVSGDALTVLHSWSRTGKPDDGR